MLIHFSAASFLKDVDALSPRTYTVPYRYKHFHKHISSADLSQLFAPQIQTWPILSPRPMWPQPAGGALSCQRPHGPEEPWLSY